MAITDNWPGSSGYLDAVQAPQISFADAQLRNARILADPYGLPLAATGKWAVVFRATVGSRDVALRCFTREASDQESRYRALYAHLADNWPSYLVDFTYRDREILVGGTRYPVVVMSWAEGQSLDAWIGQHLKRGRDLASLAMTWLEVVKDLERRGMAHGDLDNGNCLVSRSGLTLIDYDGFFVPSLADAPSRVAGIPDFQHPGRPGYYAPNMDAFPALVIYLSLLALESDRSLWRRYHTGENLIFSASDYAAPRATQIWQDLTDSEDLGVRRLTTALADMCDAPIESLPSLSQVAHRSILPMRDPAGAEEPGSYDAEINRQHPGCLLFLVDQSGSMNDAFAGSSATRKADAAADAINNLLKDVVIRCVRNFNEGPRNYFDVGVIGYGSNSGVGSCFRGALQGRTMISVSELAENPLRVEKRSRQVPDSTGGVVDETVVTFPVWLDPVAEDGAPMREAMHVASTLLESWVAGHPTSRPPIVINITGGGADTDPVAVAEKLTTTRTTDGTVLLYNVYLSSYAMPPILFSSSSQELPDFAARALFKMSTVIPQRIRQELAQEGYAVTRDARGFVFNADAAPLISSLYVGTRIFLTPMPPFPTIGDDSAVEPGARVEAPGGQGVGVGQNKQANKFIQTYLEQDVVTQQRQPMVGTSLRAFVSYSHKDERHRDKLEISLAQLRRNNVISTWHDKKILPGKEWDQEIDENLNNADLVLLLVSPDFLASDYAYSREMERALERHKSGSAIVVPIILRPCDWSNSRLASLQALPSRGRAISTWPNRDTAWLDVAQGLRRLISS